MEKTNFSELLQSAEQLSAEVDGIGELPRVERSLAQLLEESNELWSKFNQSGTQVQNAQLLLGVKGIDLSQINKKLDNLSSRKTFEPLEPVHDADIRGFLKNEKENAILSLIEQCHKSIAEEIDTERWNHVRNKWREKKNKIIAGLEGVTPIKSGFKKPFEMPLVKDIPTSRMTQCALDNKEMAYAKEVIEYNKAVTQGVIRPSLVEKFSDVANSLNDKKLSEIWEIVQYMVELPPVGRMDPITARCSPVIQGDIIKQAKLYLHNRYKTYMETLVSGNLHKARRGGQPGTYQLVRSYVSVIVPTHDVGMESIVIEGRPAWPVVYYCLRCGDYVAALHAVRCIGEGAEDLCFILEEIIKNKILPTRNRPKSFHSRNTTDVYKRAVYNILEGDGKYEDNLEVLKTADDFLWFQLCRINEEPSSSDAWNLQKLQILIIDECGEEHYDARNQPHVYFQMLFLTGQFEAAIAFLADCEKYRVHAVHIALALNELHLLGISNIYSPLCTIIPENRPMRTLNLVTLINSYVSGFEASDPNEALHYYYFLRFITDENERNIFVSALCNLTVLTKEFDLILGKMNEDGCRTPGLIDVFCGPNGDKKPLIKNVAAHVEKQGSMTDAISLYDLAGDHQKVMELLCTILSQEARLRNEPGSLRSRMQDLTNSVAQRYAGSELNCSPKTVATFNTMRDILTFFDEYNAEEYQQALNTLSKMKIVPLSSAEMDDCLKNFKHLSAEVTRVLADILLATMNILLALYNKAKGSSAPIGGSLSDVSRDANLVLLREKAKYLTCFAGTVPFRMPGDTNTRLVQMEIIMN